LNSLVAWQFSNGSIREQYFVPEFSIGTEDMRQRLEATFEVIGAEPAILDREGESKGRAARLKSDGSVLGRVLVALGCSYGAESAQDHSLPLYLDDAPTPAREEFVRTYLLNSLKTKQQDSQTAIQINSNCPDQYLQDLYQLFSDVIDQQIQQHGTEWHLQSSEFLYQCPYCLCSSTSNTP
jgi:hypothetical protein